MSADTFSLCCHFVLNEYAKPRILRTHTGKRQTAPNNIFFPTNQFHFRHTGRECPTTSRYIGSFHPTIVEETCAALSPIIISYLFSE